MSAEEKPIAHITITIGRYHDAYDSPPDVTAEQAGSEFMGRFAKGKQFEENERQRNVILGSNLLWKRNTILPGSYAVQWTRQSLADFSFELKTNHLGFAKEKEGETKDWLAWLRNFEKERTIQDWRTKHKFDCSFDSKEERFLKQIEEDTKLVSEALPLVEEMLRLCTQRITELETEKARLKAENAKVKPTKKHRSIFRPLQKFRPERRE